MKCSVPLKAPGFNSGICKIAKYHVLLIVALQLKFTSIRTAAAFYFTQGMHVSVR